MTSRTDLAMLPRAPRTFDEAFAELNLTLAERTALVWHLAAMRARKTVEVLLPQQQEPFDKQANAFEARYKGWMAWLRSKNVED